MKRFYLCWPQERIFQTLSEKCFPEISQTSSEKLSAATKEFALGEIGSVLQLPWSHYVRLLSVEEPAAQRFYQE